MIKKCQRETYFLLLNHSSIFYRAICCSNLPLFLLSMLHISRLFCAITFIPFMLLTLFFSGLLSILCSIAFLWESAEYNWLKGEANSSEFLFQFLDISASLSNHFPSVTERNDSCNRNYFFLHFQELFFSSFSFIRTLFIGDKTYQFLIRFFWFLTKKSTFELKILEYIKCIVLVFLQEKWEEKNTQTNLSLRWTCLRKCQQQNTKDKICYFFTMSKT